MPKSIPCLMVFFNQKASEQEYQNSKAHVLAMTGVKMLDVEDKGRVMALRRTGTQEKDIALIRQIEATTDASASGGSIRNDILIKNFAKNKQ